jgi:hypothetical protein
MAQLAIDKIPSDPKLDALTAEKVFGWRTFKRKSGWVENGPAVD